MDGHTDLKDRTKQFALRVISLYRQLPKSTEAQVLGRQLLRAGTSVGANTRAAFRGRSPKEFKAKIGTVIEEADECGFWLELLSDAGIMAQEHTDPLKQEGEQLVSIFVSIVKKSQKQS